jgi:O-antigen ligase
MDFGVIFMMIMIVLTVVIMPIFVPSPWRLMAAVWLSVFQIYTFPIHGFYFSLAFLFSIGLWPELIKHGKELLKWRVMQYYLLLIAIQIISLSWSPDPGKGARLIILAIPFAPIIAATIDVVGRRQDTIRILLAGVIAGAVVEAVLVISLHLMPTWEHWFISSSIARIFINPNSFSTGYMQVPNWSGFLINHNTAAGYLGITSLLAYAFALRYRQWWMMFVGLILALGVISAGSKAGLILLVIFYGAGALVLAWPILKWQGRSIVIALAALAFVFLTGNLDLFSHYIGISWTARLERWNFGLISFPEHPLRGFGFGGWEIAIQEYAKQMEFDRPSPPPHNTIITLWAQSGLLAAVLGVLFIISVFTFLWRSRLNKPWREFLLWATLAIAWYFVHQQGENWGLLNQRHIMPVIAMVIGIVYAVSHSRPAERNET